MTTLSKEDVVRWAALSGAGQRGSGYGWNFMGDEIVTFATIARADLVAENERLKATPPDQRQDLHCVVSDIAAECRELHDQLTAARTALAAAEARESATRAILDQVMDDIRSEAFLFDGGNGISADTEDAADNLLDQPRDDSALREMIAGVYDECAKVADLFEQKADALNDSIADDDDANEGRSEYIMGKATASNRIAKAIRALAEKAKGE